MLSLNFWLFISLFSITVSSQSCGPRVSPRLLSEIPCDMSKKPFCTQPGSAYPWAPLRRYIFENQGSLKRMYGEFRQSNVVQEEIDRFTARYEMFDAYGFTEFEIRRAKASQAFGQDSGERLRVIPKSRFHFPTSSASISSSASTLTPSASTSSSTPFSTIPATPSTTTSSTTTSSTTTAADPSTIPSEPEVASISIIDDSDDEESETSTHVLNFDDALSNHDEIPLEPFDNTLPEQAETPKEVKGYPACPITQEVVAPYWANNTRGETLALLNVYPFEQYIHWEKCAHEGEQMFCREGCKCEQQFRLHRLLAFDPKSECRGIFADWFRFPGSCACVCYDSLPDRINSRKARL